MTAVDEQQPVVRPSGALDLSIWQLAWPTAATMLMGSAVHMVDFLMVGSLGSTEVAALGMGAQVYFLQFGVFSAVTMGTVALVARAVGGGDLREADTLLRVSIAATAVLGLGCMLAIPAAEAIIGLFGVTDEVRRGGAVYLRIMLAASVPNGVALVFFSALRGAGDMIRPLWASLIINAVNIVGDYLLIFGKWGAPRLGLAGAAYASAIAMTTGALVMLAMWRGGRLLIQPGPWLAGIDREQTRRLLRIGIPSSLEAAVFDIGLLVFAGFMATFGTEAVSAYFIGTRVLMFSFVPGIAYQMAASTLVGQNLGALRPGEARRAGWRAMRSALVAMSTTGVVIIALAHPIASLFSGTGAETVALTVTFIYILAAAQPMIAVDFSLGGALRGAGDTRFPLVAVTTGLLGGRLLVAWLGIELLGFSITAVWCCLLIDYTTRAAMLALRFRGDHWQHVEV